MPYTFEELSELRMTEIERLRSVIRAYGHLVATIAIACNERRNHPVNDERVLIERIDQLIDDFNKSF